MKKIIAMALGASAAAVLAGSAHANIIVYAGYYDLPPSLAFPNPLPDPWAGSPNTTFLGDVAYATSGDPDQSALRIQNTGPSAVTIGQGLNIAGYQLWDTLIGASGFVLGAGKNVIFGSTVNDNFDGSDLSLTQAISVSLNGVAHNFTDANSILHGGPSSSNETIPWTEIGAVRFEGGPSVPEPASWALMIAGFGLAGAALRRRRTVLAV